MRTPVHVPPGALRAAASSRREDAPSRYARRFSRWLVPDLALVAAAVTLFYSLFFFGGYRAFFHDSDAGWHIRAGELILSSHALPRSDPFSFTAAGQPWFAWEWLADVTAGSIHRSWGLGGVAFFYALALATGVWLWFRLNWAAGGNFLFAAAFASPMLSTTNLHWLARPHVLSWLFLLITVILAEHLSARHLPPWRVLPAVVVGSALWTNIHASFLLGPAILLIYAAGHLLSPLVFSLDRQLEWTRARNLGLCALVALGATLANPYGWDLHRHVLGYLTDTALLDRVGEFQSFNFHLTGATQILVTLGLAAWGGFAALTQKNVAVFLLAVMLLALALRSARGLPLVALLLLPLANGSITRALQSATNLKAGVRRDLDRFFAYSTRLRALDSRCGGFAWAPVLALLAFALLRAPAIAARTGFPAAEFPV
ncbi:MAG: hypothetical protein M3Z09_07675, partial [Acidobacteriota bacterium]|nr:hypothetical protein [Acidobacteriota bacterium]